MLIDKIFDERNPNPIIDNSIDKKNNVIIIIDIIIMSYIKKKKIEKFLCEIS
tara:strand:+ start:9680 stop:9835 length:156 start_codon:yes stop_codon:yes gene_type:complete